MKYEKHSHNLNRNQEILHKEINDFEKGFPDGVYAGPTNPEEPILNTRAMLKYCREHGLDPEKMTKEQLKPFYVYRK